MSTPTGAGPSETKDVDRRKSLGKYVKRMSSVFKRDKSSKSKSKSSASSTPAAPSTPAPVAEEKSEATPAPLGVAALETTATPATPATPTPAPAAARPTAPAADPVSPMQDISRSALQQERARALFAKYGLTLESHEWISTPAQPANVQRVEKPIRMRVHRTCHHCGTTYGTDKVCSKCEHKRCKKCPRYPKKKTLADKGKGKEGADQPRKKKLLTVPSKTGGELVYQPVKQRVRRSCHKCQAYFVPPTATICDQCRHIRCTKCPREPAKLGKWPHGYPGDVDAGADSETDLERGLRELDMSRRVWRKPRTRVRWECEACHSLFLEGSPQCPGCGHARCEKCTRKPLRRMKKEKEFDPEVVKAVEAKLKALAVQDEQPTPTVEAS